MSNSVKAIPDGFTAVTPHLVVNGVAAAIEFYAKAFGAEEVCRMPAPDGQRFMHAEVKIGGAHVFLCDEFPEYGLSRSPQALGGSPVTIHLYVEDADAVYNQAVAAGAQAAMPLTNMFWGDRYGKVVDPFGHEWSIATHFEDVSPAEMGQRAQAAMESAPT